MNGKERRQLHRKPLRIEAIYQDSQRKYHRGMARDINVNGAYIETSHTLERGSIIHISLIESYRERIIDVDGEVVHSEPGKGMGIKFTDQDNKEIRQLISIIKMQDQTSLLSLSTSSF